ncbi:hypothetical protein [Methylobacterium oxalidis]|nr:hypothetical protein [Methylobacterium oxalidis]GJE35789.1 hypothetical protein LDDCCGHA_6009 [Methylobacterium oxalidis]
MRTLVMLAVAFVLATGAFWATMLTVPPQSVARGQIVPAVHIPLVRETMDPDRYDADGGDVF